MKTTFNNQVAIITGAASGLGLTIVKSIVDELLGEISIEIDDVLKGAKFKVWLPKE